MKVQRILATVGVVTAAALGMTACGSDNNADTDTTATTPKTQIDCGPGGTLNVEGSSAQKNAIEEAAASFESVCADVTINYNPTGSGAGIKQFTAGQVEFAGSDSVLNADKGEIEAANKRCEANDAWNLPMVTGPIAIAYNVKGVDSLVLDASTTAGIFSGDITKWNDPAIAALNPSVTLPGEEIHVFFRSDESGTSENFQKYLTTAAPKEWPTEPSKQWPAEVGEGREKSSGVAEGVATTDDSITYVEWSYAKDNNLSVAEIDTGDGPVTLTAESAATAVSAASQVGEGNDLALKLDYATTAEGAYPIVLVTYEIVCSAGLDEAETSSIKAFLTHFASEEVQDSLTELGYAPLPEDIRTKVLDSIDAIS